MTSRSLYGHAFALRGAGLAGQERLAHGGFAVGTLVRAWRVRHRYRSELWRLLEVGPYMIEDIGLGLADAIAEARRPFWRA